MKLPLFRRSARKNTISSLYGTIVAQARLPCFYREYGVPDTVDGRFDLLVLHLTVVLDRLADDPALRARGQALFDRFCQDMDHNLREMGVGDLSVPKEMQRIGEAFYGRSQAYRAALAEPGDDALVKIVMKNIYGGTASADPAQLTAYMRESAQEVRAQQRAQFLAGELHLPEPKCYGFC